MSVAVTRSCCVRRSALHCEHSLYMVFGCHKCGITPILQMRKLRPGLWVQEIGVRYPKSGAGGSGFLGVWSLEQVPPEDFQDRAAGAAVVLRAWVPICTS